MRHTYTLLLGIAGLFFTTQTLHGQLLSPARYEYSDQSSSGAVPSSSFPIAADESVPLGSVLPAIDEFQQLAPVSLDTTSTVVPAAHLAISRDVEVTCDTPCDGHCGAQCDFCCSSCGGFEHRLYLYGEFLYLRPGDAEVVWATPANSNFPVPPNVPVQIGSLGVAEPDFQPGFRAGFQYNLTECAGISAQYTMYEATTTDFVAITGANVVQSLVSHPAIDTTAQNFRQASANYAINYDLIDIDYHKLLWYGSDYQLGFLTGVSLVQMEQQFSAAFTGTGTERVATDIDFYGAGGRFGIEGETGGDTFRFYGKGLGNLIAGEFRADYDLGHSFDAVVVDTDWRANRLVGIWSLETGFKWISRCRTYSANVGYVFNAWSNVVQTDQWIRGIQTNSFVDMDDTMTFDGLVAKFEARF